MTRAQRVALEKLREINLLSVPRGFGFRGAPPAIKKQTGAWLIRKGFAKVTRIPGSIGLLIYITAEGRAALDKPPRRTSAEIDVLVAEHGYHRKHAIRVLSGKRRDRSGERKREGG